MFFKKAHTMTTENNFSRQIIAIGGGGFGRNPRNCTIEKYILQQAPTENPRICFIPTASAEDQRYIVNFYTCFSKLSCVPTHLSFFQRTPNLRSIIAKQDIIYVGGGNTKSMLAVWKEWKLDKLLLKAYHKGVVLCGVSAGAICWFQKGITDSWASQLSLLDCLNFIPAISCPHYDGEKDRRPTVFSMIKENIIESCYAIEDGAALHFKDEKVAHAVSFEQDKKAYSVTKKNDELIEETLPSLSLYNK